MKMKFQSLNLHSILINPSTLAILVLLAFTLPSNGELSAQDDLRTAFPNVLLLPTADAMPRTNVDAYLLSFPTALAGQITFPFTQRLSIQLAGGFMGYPTGSGGAASLRFHAWQPDATRWGLATSAQWLGGYALSVGEGRGGGVSALHLVASSPVRRSRIHFGVALHTMPGSEFEPGWQAAKDYDFKNPQLTLFVSGSHRAIFPELIWGAVDADDGWDSIFVGLVGARIPLGRANLKIGTGLLVQRFGSGNASV